MPRPRLLTTDDWPEAELRAAVLAGELVPVGACWASPAEPQDAALRAEAVAWSLPDDRLVAAHRTAAWVWGALSRPPCPLECVVPSRVRLRVDPAAVHVREVALLPDDVRVVAGLRVTAPLRTAVDLLRAPGPGPGGAGTGGTGGTGVGGVPPAGMHPADEDAVRGLVGTGVVEVGDLRRALGALGVVPMVRQAERRVAALFGPPARSARAR